MGLKDLYAIAKRHKASGTEKASLVTEIDRFMYREYVQIEKGELSAHDVSVAAHRTLLQIVKKKLSQIKTKTTDRQKFFHPSSLGGCAAKTFFNYFDAPSDIEADESIEEVAKSLRIFSNGDYFHLRMGALFLRMGLCTIDDIEIPFESGDEQGTCDAIIDLHGEKYIVDFKTINDRGFRKKELDEKYAVQMRMYMKHFSVHKGIFLFENKDNQRMYEVFVLGNKWSLREVDSRLEYLRKHIKEKAVPEREGTNVDTAPCRWCGFTGICWNKKEQKAWLSTLKRKA